uniref:Uncharacterized protein n=1 Tax=viral metagenome TaxID=1070528 RepID=A0A6C0C9R1_9ZZZZ
MAEPKFISWSDAFQKSDFPYFLSYHDLTLLNTLAPVYHSGFGYKLVEFIPDPDVDLAYRLRLIPRLIIMREEKYILINPKVAKKFSCSHPLRHKTIAVRLGPEGQGGWESKPDKTNKTCFHKEIMTPKYWYEFPEEKIKSNRGSSVLTGPLSDRKYIHVIDLFEEIEIRSEEKNSPITIDDVLFACRGICGDDTRSIKSFNVLSDDGYKLVLMANIDNWST